jgi:hypothetical protein
MRCDSCKHWQNASDNEEWEARHAGFGECKAVRERWRIMDEASDASAKPKGWAADDSDWDEWGDSPPPADSFVGVRIAALKAARAYLQDGSEYRAELFTAPDFFCALYSPVASAPPVP